MFKKWCTTKETKENAANEYIAKFKQYHAPKNLIVKLEKANKEPPKRKALEIKKTSREVMWCPMEYHPIYAKA
eukprot:11193593-Lingulodinium_polyedra.AAC.2